MEYEIITLFNGFPAKSSRGFLGWSSVYLIKLKEYDKEKFMLFDTGGYNERFELVKRLEALNLNVNDINAIFISHLHFDHSVNWTLFPNAKIYMSLEELNNAQKSRDIMIPDFHSEKLIESKNFKIVKEGDSLFGFEVIKLPGHTLNLFGLKINSTYLVSDAIKNRREILNGPESNTVDITLAEHTINYIVNNADIIYPGHDVPLIKSGGSWQPLIDNEILINYLGGLKDVDEKTAIELKINTHF